MLYEDAIYISPETGKAIMEAADEDVGAAFRAAFDYYIDGTAPELSGAALDLFNAIRTDNDDDSEGEAGR